MKSMRMKLIGSTGMVTAVLLLAIIAHAGAFPSLQVGDTYEITLTKDTTRHGSNGSSGSSHDKDTITERVIGLRAEGLELLYDLPNGATANERAENWQFPARVFKPLGGPAQLLNGPELETRVDGWLKAAGMSRTACGHWIFTWNAFRIECDPQSVVKIIQLYDLRSASLREGAIYKDTDACSSGILARKAGGLEGEIFAVEMPLNPDPVRRTRAESDVALGEILNKPVSLDAALSNRANEMISGTISIAFETDSAGNARRRTKVTQLDITGPGGLSETQTITETLERRLNSQRD
jgi:hypothetical protein